MNRPDRVWEDLAQDWQRSAEAPELAALRERARRHGRRLAMYTAIELAITTVAAASLVVVWQQSTSLESRLLIVGLAVFSAIAGAFTLLNRRGTWRVGQETLDGYRVLEGRRHVMRINGARFAWMASTLMLPFLLALSVWRLARDGGVTFEAMVAMSAVVYLVVWIVVGRRQERRLRGTGAPGRPR